MSQGPGHGASGQGCGNRPKSHTAAVDPTLALLWLPLLSMLGLSRAVAECFPAVHGSSVGTVALGCGVILVYTGERLVEPGRIAPPLQPWLWGVVALSIIGTLVCAALDPARLIPVDMLLGLCSVCYGLAKRIPVAKSVAVALAWSIGCILLPLEFSFAAGVRALASPAALGLGLCVAAGTIMCDYKDVGADRMAGVRSAPVLLGVRSTMLLTGACSLAAIVCAYMAGGAALGVCALSLLLLSPQVRLLSRPCLGPAIVDGALAVPGLWLMFVGY